MLNPNSNPRQPTLGKEWKSPLSTSPQSVGRRQRGSVTAELAIALPAVLVILAVLLLAVSAGILQLRLEEAARAAARSVARGESTSLAVETAQGIVGNDVVVTVKLKDGYATVAATGKVRGALAGFVPWEQRAQATARVEKVTAVMKFGIGAIAHGIT